MAIDSDRIRRAVTELLGAIGDDPGRPGLVETPDRVVEAYAEMFAGVGVDPASIFDSGVDIGIETTEVPIVVAGIPVRSVCEHHLLPFLGTAAIAYVPGDRVAGLGRFVRAVDLAAARPQMQERLTDDIADAIERGLGARGALVVIRAEHTCVSARGSRTQGTEAVTIAARGSLAAGTARLEALALMGAEQTRGLVETDPE